MNDAAAAGSDDPAPRHAYWPDELNARFTDPEFRGQGAMGRVWSAFDKQQHRHVAVKVLREDVGQYAESRHRFQEEAARMQGVPPHPNVVQIFDYGTLGDWCFLTMPLLTGPYIGRNGLEVPAVLGVIGETAAGLAHLHDHQIVHRDVKPRNLVFDGEVVKIVDFGIAKAIDVSPYTKVSAGTVGFMAPELHDPNNEVTPACDIYSLGCVLFFLLTGFPWGSPPPVDRDHDPARTIPSALRPLLDRMLATDPARRPSAREVGVEVASFLQQTLAYASPAEPKAAPRTRIVPTPEPPATPLAAPTARLRVEQPLSDEAARNAPSTALHRFHQEWFTARGQFGREKLSATAWVVAVGAWLFTCLGGGWLLSIAVLLLLTVLGVA